MNLGNQQLFISTVIMCNMMNYSWCKKEYSKSNKRSYFGWNSQFRHFVQFYIEASIFSYTHANLPECLRPLNLFGLMYITNIHN
jgi:hypothetical protein